MQVVSSIRAPSQILRDALKNRFPTTLSQNSRFGAPLQPSTSLSSQGALSPSSSASDAQGPSTTFSQGPFLVSTEQKPNEFSTQSVITSSSSESNDGGSPSTKPISLTGQSHHGTTTGIGDQVSSVIYSQIPESSLLKNQPGNIGGVSGTTQLSGVHTGHSVIPQKIGVETFKIRPVDFSSQSPSVLSSGINEVPSSKFSQSTRVDDFQGNQGSVKGQSGSVPVAGGVLQAPFSVNHASEISGVKPFTTTDLSDSKSSSGLAEGGLLTFSQQPTSGKFHLKPIFGIGQSESISPSKLANEVSTSTNSQRPGLGISQLPQGFVPSEAVAIPKAEFSQIPGTVFSGSRPFSASDQSGIVSSDSNDVVPQTIFSQRPESVHIKAGTTSAHAQPELASFPVINGGVHASTFSGSPVSETSQVISDTISGQSDTTSLPQFIDGAAPTQYSETSGLGYTQGSQEIVAEQNEFTPSSVVTSGETSQTFSQRPSVGFSVDSQNIVPNQFSPDSLSVINDSVFLTSISQKPASVASKDSQAPLAQRPVIGVSSIRPGVASSAAGSLASTKLSEQPYSGSISETYKKFDQVTEKVEVHPLVPEVQAEFAVQEGTLSLSEGSIPTNLEDQVNDESPERYPEEQHQFSVVDQKDSILTSSNSPFGFPKQEQHPEVIFHQQPVAQISHDSPFTHRNPDSSLLQYHIKGDLDSQVLLSSGVIRPPVHAQQHIYKPIQSSYPHLKEEISTDTFESDDIKIDHLSQGFYNSPDQPSVDSGSTSLLSIKKKENIYPVATNLPSQTDSDIHESSFGDLEDDSKYKPSTSGFIEDQFETDQIISQPFHPDHSFKIKPHSDSKLHVDEEDISNDSKNRLATFGQTAVQGLVDYEYPQFPTENIAFEAVVADTRPPKHSLSQSPESTVGYQQDKTKLTNFKSIADSSVESADDQGLTSGNKVVQVADKSSFKGSSHIHLPSIGTTFGGQTTFATGVQPPLQQSDIPPVTYQYLPPSQIHLSLPAQTSLSNSVDSQTIRVDIAPDPFTDSAIKIDEQHTSSDSVHVGESPSYSNVENQELPESEITYVVNHEDQMRQEVTKGVLSESTFDDAQDSDVISVISPTTGLTSEQYRPQSKPEIVQPLKEFTYKIPPTHFKDSATLPYSILQQHIIDQNRVIHNTHHSFYPGIQPQLGLHPNQYSSLAPLPSQVGSDLKSASVSSSVQFPHFGHQVPVALPYRNVMYRTVATLPSQQGQFTTYTFPAYYVLKDPKFSQTNIPSVQDSEDSSQKPCSCDRSQQNAKFSAVVSDDKREEIHDEEYDEKHFEADLLTELSLDDILSLNSRQRSGIDTEDILEATQLGFSPGGITASNDDIREDDSPKLTAAHLLAAVADDLPQEGITAAQQVGISALTEEGTFKETQPQLAHAVSESDSLPSPVKATDEASRVVHDVEENSSTLTKLSSTYSNEEAIAKKESSLESGSTYEVQTEKDDLQILESLPEQSSTFSRPQSVSFPGVTVVNGISSEPNKKLSSSVSPLKPSSPEFGSLIQERFPVIDSGRVSARHQFSRFDPTTFSHRYFRPVTQLRLG